VVPDVENSGSTSEADDDSTGATTMSPTSDPSSATTTTDDGPISTSLASTSGPGSTSNDPGTESGDSSTGTVEPAEPLCPNDREFAVSVSGTNQNAHEGRLVSITALEPSFEMADDPGLVVHMEATIQGGAFDLTCPMGLSENTAYPAVAVMLDVNDDGDCSDGDLAFVWQGFAWNSAQRYAFDGDSVYWLEDDPPWLISENAWQPAEGMMGFDGGTFCDYYFP
jgi:hypothetical protein